jgi:hypothetical protein
MMVSPSTTRTSFTAIAPSGGRIGPSTGIADEVVVEGGAVVVVVLLVTAEVDDEDEADGGVEGAVLLDGELVS